MTAAAQTEVGKPDFWRKVDMTGDCWLWSGPHNGRGYGRIRFGEKKKSYVHRAIYETICGPLQSGQEVMHVCDNPRCVRPSHLRAGTHADNMRDMIAKGRRVQGPSRNREKTICPRGHEYSPTNTGYHNGNGRYCKACHRVLERERQRRLRNPT